VSIKIIHPLFPAYEKIELVTGKSTCERGKNHERKGEIPTVYQESGQYQYCLTFKESAQQNKYISIIDNERLYPNG